MGLDRWPTRRDKVDIPKVPEGSKVLYQLKTYPWFVIRSLLRSSNWGSEGSTDSTKYRTGSICPRVLNLLLFKKNASPRMPCKNHFLNLPRTGGISVNCFRLPPRRHAHHSQFRPLHFMLAQELILYSSTTGKHNIPSF